MNGTDENGALVRADHEFPEATGDQTLVQKMRDVLAATEVMIQLQERILTTAIRLTNPKDWTNLGGKPYCCEAGCTHAASHLPVKSWFVSAPSKRTLDDDQGPYYIYQCEVAAAWKTGLGEVTAIGTCSSRDKFFASVGGERKAMSDVDEPNVMKKCATNGLGNAYRRLFGFNNLTWERLESLGIKKADVVGVSYDGKKADDSPETEKSKDEIRNKILELCNGDTKEAASYLEKLTTWTNDKGELVKGKQNVKYLTEKQVGRVLRVVRDAHAAAGKQAPQEGGAS
jgi:hypothetical protein